MKNRKLTIHQLSESNKFECSTNSNQDPKEKDNECTFEVVKDLKNGERADLAVILGRELLNLTDT